MRGKILMLFFVFVNVLASGSTVFNELYYKTCNKSCTLQPEIGKPFNITYRIEKDGNEEEGIDYLAAVTLNGKGFKLLRTSYNSIDESLPFYQEKFFEDHRFQIFSLLSSRHMTSDYSFYFVRDGDEFYLLDDDALPGMAYDYGATDKPANERFYAEVGYGRGRYARQNYKLDGHRFVEIE